MVKLDKVEKEFAELYSEMHQIHGLDHLLTRIFTIAYLEPEEISMEEIADKTGYSLASVSNKVKIFEQMGILTRVKKPGTKKIFLKSEKNFLRMTRDHMLKKEEIGIKHVKKRLPDIIKELKKENLTKKQKKKLNILQEYQRQIVFIEKALKETTAIFEKALNEYEKS